MPMYNFDPAEEQDDLEQELLDHNLTGPNNKVVYDTGLKQCPGYTPLFSDTDPLLQIYDDTSLDGYIMFRLIFNNLQ